MPDTGMVRLFRHLSKREDVEFAKWKTNWQIPVLFQAGSAKEVGKRWRLSLNRQCRTLRRYGCLSLQESD